MKYIIKNQFKSWKISIFVLFFLLIFLIIPFDLTISEKRIFRVFDDHGTPLSHCEIDQRWTQYALSYEKRESLSCNEDGFVHLPKRTVRTSWAELISGAYAKFKKYGLHASYMSDDMVVISAPGFETELISAYEWKSNRVILKKKQPR
ncbi:MAG: hypothetical protein WHT06_10710 [Desulfobacterales bacterium]